MINNLRPLLVAAVIGLYGCGGGGGGGGSDNSPGTNACENLGLGARIINGTQCNPGSSPVVRIHINNVGYCTGTLISPNKVLTADHCVTNETFTDVTPASAFSISFGDESGTLAGASRIISNTQAAKDLDNISTQAAANGETDATFNLSKYIEQYGLADMAVIVLDRNLSLPTLPIRTSTLPASGEILSIFGYGTTDPNVQVPSSSLFSGQMQLAYAGVKNLFAKFDGSGSDTCNGDSGGPLVAQESDGSFSLVGTTLGGADKCVSGDTAIFTATAGSGLAAFLHSAAPDATYR